MTDEAFGRSSWERRWAQVVRESPEMLASRPPNAHLLAEVGDLRPGYALDAGCGHGSEAIWLATSGWRVTAVDFSATALDYGRSTADKIGADVAERIQWVEGDLGSWTPPRGRFDLVSCLYVHVAGSVVEMVRRLATGVTAGGTLLLVGHRPTRPRRLARQHPAAGQVPGVRGRGRPRLSATQPSGSSIRRGGADHGPTAGTGVDAVVRAVRTARSVSNRLRHESYRLRRIRFKAGQILLATRRAP